MVTLVLVVEAEVLEIVLDTLDSVEDELADVVDVVDEIMLEVTLDTLEDVDTELDDVEDEVVDFVDEDDVAVPSAAVPCIRSSVYPPSLQNVRYDAEIPSELGRKTSGILRDAPAAKMEPTVGKLGDVYPLPTIEEVTLLYGIPLA
jgi:hypothetical protein